MPYLKLTTNINISKDQTAGLLTQLSQSVAQGTGKSERYVMIELEDNKTMLFSGTHAPLAFVECKSIGLIPAKAKQLSASISQLLSEQLSIPADRVYIEFSDNPVAFWGWNGSTFA